MCYAGKTAPYLTGLEYYGCTLHVAAQKHALCQLCAYKPLRTCERHTGNHAAVRHSSIWRASQVCCCALRSFVIEQDMLAQSHAEYSTLLSDHTMLPACHTHIEYCLLIAQGVFEGAAADSTGHRSVVRQPHTSIVAVCTRHLRLTDGVSLLYAKHELRACAGLMLGVQMPRNARQAQRDSS